MLDIPKNIKTLLKLTVGLSSLLILIILLPTLEGFFFLYRGSEKLTQAERQHDESLLLQSAIRDLQKATMLLPDEPLAWRRLAQALKRAGDSAASIDALQRASSLESLLADKELIIAYLSMGLRSSKIAEEFDLDFDRCVTIGDEYLNVGDGLEALSWYSRAAQLQPERINTLLFRRLVAAIQANDIVANELLNQISVSQNLSIIDLKKDNISIDGSAMHRIPSGDPSNLPYGGSNAIFWSNGRSSLLIRVEEQGDYLIRAMVSHATPPPVKIAFGVNGRIIQYSSLDRGDNSWDLIEFQVTLRQPINTIDFWFLNDEWDPKNNIDRNASISKIIISRISTNQ